MIDEKVVLDQNLPDCLQPSVVFFELGDQLWRTLLAQTELYESEDIACLVGDFVEVVHEMQVLRVVLQIAFGC